MHGLSSMAQLVAQLFHGKIFSELSRTEKELAIMTEALGYIKLVTPEKFEPEPLKGLGNELVCQCFLPVGFEKDLSTDEHF